LKQLNNIGVFKKAGSFSPSVQSMPVEYYKWEK